MSFRKLDSPVARLACAGAAAVGLAPTLAAAQDPAAKAQAVQLFDSADNCMMQGNPAQGG